MTALPTTEREAARPAEMVDQLRMGDGSASIVGRLSRVWCLSGTLWVLSRWLSGARTVRGESHLDEVRIRLQVFCVYCLLVLISAVGASGFVAINNADAPWETNLVTQLPAGRYCDVISGRVEEGLCTGVTYVLMSTPHAHPNLPWCRS